jgi:hypothetical protein
MLPPIPHVDPVPELASWEQTLTRIAGQPLEFCPDFPAIAARHEAWWRQQNTRPLFIATANTNPARPITKRLELLDKPEE